MTKIIALLLASIPIMISCSAISNKKEQQEKYHFLFEKELQSGNTKDCMAVFDREGLLYFFTSYYNKLYKITVYNPAVGEFAQLPILNENAVSCKSLPYAYQEPHQTQWLRVAVMQSPGFRHLFNNYKQDPVSLKNAINATPYLFRVAGDWNGETTASLTNKSFRADTLQDVIDYLR